MAILQTAPNVLKVTFIGHWSNAQIMTNTAHFVYSSGADIDSEAAVAIVEDVRDVWQNEILDIVCDNYTFDGCVYLDMKTITGVTGEVLANTALPVAGTLVGAAAPPQVCTLVKKTIAASGRGRKPGRWYLPAGDEGSWDENGNITPAALTPINARLAATLSAWNAVVVPGGDLLVTALPHYLAADKPEDVEGEQVIWPAEAVSFVTGLVCDTKAGTQRRRLR